jgi:hypothetical protein
MHNALRRSGASGGGDDEGISSVDLTAVETLLGAVSLDDASGGERSNERVAGRIGEARVKGHRRIAAFPDLREGLDKALASLGNRH